MSRRAILLLPLLIVPIIVGGIAGGLSYLLPRTVSSGAVLNAANPQVEPTRAADSVPVGSANAEPVPTLAPNQSAALDSEDAILTRLYSERSPSVVAIRIQGNDPGASTGGFELPDPEESPAPDASDAPEFNFEAQGSGFLLDEDGHIITNNHVVEGAEVIEVAFTNGLVVEASVVGTDADSDIAVLKVEERPENAKPLTLGDSKQVQVGQRAIAIGNPFGLRTTLTVGVVSARGRTFPSRATGQGPRYSIADVIQTDAAINPGNSGGPLFNSSGEIIGINTAIRSEGGTFEGVGFAVPSNTVKKVTSALIETGTYEHPYLGVSLWDFPLTTIVAKELNLPARQGVFLARVVEGGPAAEAGLRAADENEVQTVNGDPYPVGSDIILFMNDTQISADDDVLDFLATETEVGQKVTVTILRDGKEQKVEVTIGARPRQ